MAFIPGKSQTKIEPDGHCFQARYRDEEIGRWFDLGDPRNTYAEAQALVNEFHFGTTVKVTFRPAGPTGWYKVYADGSLLGEVHKRVERFNLVRSVTSITWQAYRDHGKVSDNHRTRKDAVDALIRLKEHRDGNR